MFYRRDFLISALLASATPFSLAQEGEGNDAIPQAPVVGDNATGTTEEENKALIVYYSQSGKSEKIAQILADLLSAPTYRIETTRPYNPMDAKEDRRKGILPEIKKNIPSLAKYNWIVLVFPIWGYTVSLPMQKFLSMADLQDKKIIAVAVGEGKLGGTFARLSDMLKGGSLERTHAVSFVDKRSDKDLKALMSRWNTGTVPKRVLLSKGIQTGGVPLTEVVVVNQPFALRLPRTATYSASPAHTHEELKPADPAPGIVTINAEGLVTVDGVPIGKTTTKLAKGTFVDGEPLTFY